MKIAVDIRVLMDQQYSGISEYVYYLLRSWLDDHPEHEYIFYYNSWRPLPREIFSWVKGRATFKKTRWPNKIFNYFFQFLCRRPKLDRLVGPVDIFWSPHLNFSNFGEPATLKVLTVHDLSFLRYPEFFTWRKNFWHRFLRLKKLVAQYDFIVAISENTKQDLIELLGVPAEKIKVIYSGVNKDSVTLTPEEIRNFRVKNDLNSHFILYLGAIEPRKNVQGLIEAYERLRDKRLDLSNYHLVLAGAKGWKNRAIYRQASDSLYKDDIKFLGYVSREERNWLYDQATIFVYPSYYEGFGFPPLEAMSHGQPTITSDASAIPEVVGDAAITVNPYSVIDLAHALETLLEDESLRRYFSERGRARAAWFSWSETAKNYFFLFQELYARRNPSR
jgi:glycosyltransferase involved in cell wall biosynthesis